MANESSMPQKVTLPELGSYVIRSVIDDIPLYGDLTDEEISITCVEHWKGNLYIGTSASELLHLVAIPSEEEYGPPTFILASRLQPSGHGASRSPHAELGVQQILVLPGPMKALVLCNGTVSFYSLPELSPAFTTKEPTGVQWIGGYDENDAVEEIKDQEIMIATMKRILLVQIGDRLRSSGSVDYPGCLRSSRRETIACVANETSYALLEVKHQQQIPLIPISSANLQAETPPDGATQHRSPGGHSRSTSLGTNLSLSSNQADNKSLNLEPATANLRARSPQSHESQPTAARPRSSTDVSAQPPSRGRMTRLKPHILSPTPAEFMLTTGTNKLEGGVGVFFNLDGDPSRGSVEFERYPDDVLIHYFGSLENAADDEHLHLFALMERTDTISDSNGIEVQDLSGQTRKTWIPLPERAGRRAGGLHKCLTEHQYLFPEVISLLQSVRYKPSLPDGILEADLRTKASIKRLEQETALFEDQSPRTDSPTLEYELNRNEDERRFVVRLAQMSSSIVVWSGERLWQILQAPILLELENALSTSVPSSGEHNSENFNISKILSLLGSIRDREPSNEVEFWSLKYIRQKASLLLFLHLQRSMGMDTNVDSACQIVRSALQEGEIDPRVVLLLIPPLAREVVQGSNGIWLPSGIVAILEDSRSSVSRFQEAPVAFWQMVRQFLSDWQEKRGYGSITDEKLVFDSVDASILHVLLYLDQSLPKASSMQASTRVKLHNVVDYWKGDFNRAVILLEYYRRFFVLSRLYQSRKLAKDVLATWKRIAEGEHDEDESLTLGMVELQMRRYLTKISNATLVQDYGVWLARRNPDLAVQVFADDASRVKLAPAQVTKMLKEHAPKAVQKYLEYLVFGKKLNQYADDLIGYYLDSLIEVLRVSTTAKESLQQSYAAYRALESPKPTYLNFIADNTPPEPWWQSRLRLLQLLGTSEASEFTYSTDKILERISPFSSYLVSESIILDARQGRHEEALRLLTHGLGDFDTAIRYCYFAGPAPQSSRPLEPSMLPSKAVQQALFTALFKEFLQIENIEERLDRTSHLLGVFAPWFDPLTIFEEIPSDWTVDVLSEFLVRSLRAAISEKNKAIIIRALTATDYLQKQVIHIDLCEKAGSHLENTSTESTA